MPVPPALPDLSAREPPARAWVPLLLVALVVGRPLAAQAPDSVPLRPGQWVRHETPDRTVEGELLSVSRFGSRVRLQGGPTVGLSREETAQLRVRVRQGRFKRILAGTAAVGAGVGALVGAISTVRSDTCSGPCDPWRSQRAAHDLAVGFAVGASVGVVAGLLFGSERWAAGALRPGAGGSGVVYVTPHSGRLELSASFPQGGGPRVPH